MSLTRRVQLLLDPARYDRVERAASAAGSSVAAVIRHAIDRHLPEDRVEPAEAGRLLLSAPPIPVGDWGDMKSELVDEMNHR